MDDKEYRFLPVELVNIRAKQDSDDLVVEGTAIVYNTVTKLWDSDEEIIFPGAATESIKGDDIRAVWNHDTSIVLGRNKSNTLELFEDEKGVHCRIYFPKSEEGKNKFESVKRGDVSQMSFAFKVLKFKWDIREEEDKNIWRREIITMKIFEVSPCTFPQYEDTSLEARNKEIALRGKPEGLARPDDTAVLEVFEADNDNLAFL